MSASADSSAPDTPDALLAHGLAHHNQGRLHDAERHYRRLLEIDPGNRDGLHLLGVIAHQTGHHDVAIGLMRQALQDGVLAPEVHNNLGEVYRTLGRFDEARAQFRLALVLVPGYETARRNLRLASAPLPPRGAPAPGPTDNDLHVRLGAAILGGTVGIAIDARRINHMDCPVAGAAYHTADVYVVVALCAALFAVLPAVWAAGLAGALLAVNWLVVLPLIRRWMERFAIRHLIKRFDLWQRMWKFGGVTLTARTPEGGDLTAHAPADDWRRVARALVRDPDGSGWRT